jgi:hypothetical protein
MSALVTTSRHRDVLVIEVTNPPVNALGPGVLGSSSTSVLRARLMDDARFQNVSDALTIGRIEEIPHP